MRLIIDSEKLESDLRTFSNLDEKEMYSSVGEAVIRASRKLILFKDNEEISITKYIESFLHADSVNKDFLGK